MSIKVEDLKPGDASGDHTMTAPAVLDIRVTRLRDGRYRVSMERAISEIRDDISQKRTMLELLEKQRDAMRPRAVRGGAA